MRNLINRILVKLGLRMPQETFSTTGCKTYFEEYRGIMHAFLPDKVLKWNGEVWVDYLEE